MLVHWIWFAELPEKFIKEKIFLLNRFRDPEEIINTPKRTLASMEELSPELIELMGEKDLAPAEKILRRCSDKHIRILTYGDADYPARLRNIFQPPILLYYAGKLPAWDSRPAIGIVGTRDASPYGLQMARTLGKQISCGGAMVVSGAAAGIDAAAMTGALEGPHPVVGVLGCGIDVVYPASSRELYRSTALHGCLLSEYAPGTRPMRWNFLPRNRIIAGLSNGVVIVEAPERSGALNTARQAFEQGKDVFAVPGNVGLPVCAGSNALLGDRALPAVNGWSVLKEYEHLYPGILSRVNATDEVIPKPPVILPETRPQPQAPEKKKIDKSEKCGYSVTLEGLSPEETAVLSRLSSSPMRTDAVIDACNLPAGRVLSILTRLIVKGAVQKHPGGLVSLK